MDSNTGHVVRTEPPAATSKTGADARPEVCAHRMSMAQTVVAFTGVTTVMDLLVSAGVRMLSGDRGGTVFLISFTVLALGFTVVGERLVRRKYGD